MASLCRICSLSINKQTCFFLYCLRKITVDQKYLNIYFKKLISLSNIIWSCDRLITFHLHTVSDGTGSSRTTRVSRPHATVTTSPQLVQNTAEPSRDSSKRASQLHGTLLSSLPTHCLTWLPWSQVGYLFPYSLWNIYCCVWLLKYEWQNANRIL